MADLAAIESARATFAERFPTPEKRLREALDCWYSGGRLTGSVYDITQFTADIGAVLDTLRAAASEGGENG